MKLIAIKQNGWFLQYIKDPTEKNIMEKIIK